MDPSVKLIIWLVFLVLGCFGTVYGPLGGGRYWGTGGGLCLFIAILMLHFMKF